MRIVISDPHVAFGESLAHVLTSRGARVVAIVQKVSEVAVVLSRQAADMCVVGLGSDTTLSGDRYTAMPGLVLRVPVIVLAEAISPSLRAECVVLGIRGLGEMRQGMSDVLRLLDRVRRGDSVLDLAGRPERQRPRPDDLNDARRMALFLSARERAVLSALVRGEDTVTVARSLDITRTTARGHIQGVLTKLGTHTRVGAVTLAVRAQLVNPVTGEWQPL